MFRTHAKAVVANPQLQNNLHEIARAKQKVQDVLDKKALAERLIELIRVMAEEHRFNVCIFPFGIIRDGAFLSHSDPEAAVDELFLTTVSCHTVSGLSNVTGPMSVPLLLCPSYTSHALSGRDKLLRETKWQPSHCFKIAVPLTSFLVALTEASLLTTLSSRCQ